MHQRNIRLKFLCLAIFFLPLGIYKWRIASFLPALSVSEYLFLFLVLTTPFAKFPKGILLPISILTYFIVAGMFFIQYNLGYFIHFTFVEMFQFLMWIGVILIVSQTVISTNDYSLILICIALSSLWLMIGFGAHFYESFSHNYWISPPLSDFLHCAESKSYESTSYAMTRASSMLSGGFKRFSFPISNSSSIAGITSSLMCLCSGYTMNRIRQYRNILRVCFFIAFLYSLLTFSKAAYLSLFFGFFIASFITFRKRNNYHLYPRSFSLPRIIFIICSGMLSVTVLWRLRIPQLIFYRLHNISSSLSGHIETRIRALRFVTDNIFLGLGLGGYKAKSIALYGDYSSHPHSNYFLIISEHGIVGLFFFCVFLLLPIVLIFFNLKYRGKINKDVINIFLILHLTIVFGMLLYNLSYPLIYVISAIAWNMAIFGVQQHSVTYSEYIKNSY